MYFDIHEQFYIQNKLSLGPPLQLFQVNFMYAGVYNESGIIIYDFALLTVVKVESIKFAWGDLGSKRVMGKVESTCNQFH